MDEKHQEKAFEMNTSGLGILKISSIFLLVFHYLI
jgi:hypothetical protein